MTQETGCVDAIDQRSHSGLCDAAARHGRPSAVTLRAVGDAAGISQSAPYRHHAGKPALLEAMVRAILDYFNAALETAKYRLVRAYFDFARLFPVRYRFLLEVSREDSPLGAEVRQALGAVTSLVRAAQQAGELKDGDAEQIAAFNVQRDLVSTQTHRAPGR